MEGVSIEYGGSCVSNPRNRRAGSHPDFQACGSMFVGGNGDTISQKALDRAPWENLFSDLQAKSK